MEIILVIVAIAQTIGTIAAAVIAVKALSRDKGNDQLLEKSICVIHSESLKNLREDVIVLFDKVKKVEEHTTAIEVIKTSLDNITEKTTQTHNLLMALFKEKGGIK